MKKEIKVQMLNKIKAKTKSMLMMMKTMKSLKSVARQSQFRIHKPDEEETIIIEKVEKWKVVH